MDAFENIVAKYLEATGFWIRRSVKVNLTKEHKRTIKKHSMPRPEIDLVALNFKTNTLLLVEAKSYIDSPGVQFSGVSGGSLKDAKRYKLFTDNVARRIISKQLLKEYVAMGLANAETKVNYALVAGHVKRGDEPAIRKYFNKRGWYFVPPSDLRSKILELAKSNWEDDEITITAKIALRE
ncbi:MAG: hypothetical protein U1C56_02260 [Candidatus Curtissbacteria bacterium]|nr:hypothetical protein [Candidatus Curtissbacteria bacterium]